MIRYHELKPGDKFRVIREKETGGETYLKLSTGYCDLVNFRTYRDYHGGTTVELVDIKI